MHYRIALHVREFVPSLGGLEAWVSCLARALVERGHAVRIVTTRSDQEIPGTECTIISTAPSPMAQAQLFAATARPGEIIHDTGIGLGGDVFQPQMGSLSLNMARDDASQRWPLRLRRAINADHRQLLSDMASLEFEQLHHAKCVVAVSRETARIFRERFNLPDDRLTVIPNGIDITRFSPAPDPDRRAAVRQKLGIVPTDVMLLSAAQNFHLKGVHLTIRALSMLRRSHPALRLVVAGGDDHAGFSALAAQAGVADRVQFLGRVEDMPALFAAADIFVHPTLHDACSLATLEALASGLPVITTLRNGAADGMADGREGVLLATPNARSVAAALRRLAGKTQREAMRVPARRLAEQHAFSTTVDRLEAVYGLVLSRQKHRKAEVPDEAGRGTIALAWYLYRLRKRLFPLGSRREALARKVYKPMFAAAARLFPVPRVLGGSLNMLGSDAPAVPDRSAPLVLQRPPGVLAERQAMAPIKSVLIIKVDHIGDFVISLDAILALRAAFPEAHVTLVCGPWNKELAESLGLFDVIHTVEFFAPRSADEQPRFSREMLSALEGKIFDVAIDLRVQEDTRVILNQIVARYRFGYGGKGLDSNLTISIPAPPQDTADSAGNPYGHQRLMLLRLAEAAVDFCSPRDNVRALLHSRLPQTGVFDLAIVAGRPLVACNIGSGNKIKDWPVERYAELFALLCNERGIAVLLLGTPDQAADAAIAMAGCRPGSIVSALGKTSLPEALQVLTQATMFLGNDSGLTHLAARMGLPTIALFSGVAELEQWAPDGPDVSILHVPLSCSGCRITRLQDCVANWACMNNISVEAVAAAIEHKLAGLNAGAGLLTT